jgi:predicted nuclease of predicted toxin-antitoxin system
MILADEGLNFNLIKALRSEGYSVEWIQDVQVGMADREVIAFAKDKGSILITEDKDFGEWVFAHHISGLTIIFLRYDKEDYMTILSFLKLTLKTIELGVKKEFITINKNKVRRRQL